MLERVIELTAETLGAEAASITEAVEIPSEDLEKITTVGDVIAYIEEHK